MANVNKIDIKGEQWDIEDVTARKNLTYSTLETDTGKTWIDGKPIYRKTFTGATIGTYPLGIANIKEVVNINGIVKGQGSYMPNGVYPIVGLATAERSQDTNFIYCGIINSNTQLEVSRMGAGQGVVCTGFIITIEYTKTTD